MFAQLVSTYHLHPIVDHFTIALLTFGIAAEIFFAAAIFFCACASLSTRSLRSKGVTSFTK